MIPTGRLLGALALLLGLAACAPWWAPAGPLALSASALLLALAWLDGRRLPRVGALEAVPLGPRAARVGEVVSVGVQVQAARRLFVWWREALPEALGAGLVSGEGWAQPGAPLTLSFELTPRRRGVWPWGAALVRLRSPLGLVWRDGDLGRTGELQVRVPVRAAGWPPAARRLSERAGLRSGLRPGAGSEFLYLRDLAPGEGKRFVDWKASARRGLPVVRQYTEERSLTVVILLDLGYAMARQVAGLSRLDHAMEAALELAAACSRAGDRVGLVAFGSHLVCHLPPRAGRQALPDLREAMVRLQPETGSPDLKAPLQHLLLSYAPRSLLVLFTAVHRPDNAVLLEGVAGAARRHQVVLAGVADDTLRRLAEAPARDGLGALTKGAAITLLEEQRQTLKALQRAGGYVVEVPPGGLASAVVGRYLALRARG